MKKIELRYTIKAPIASVWRALVDPIIINQWGGGPAIMTPYIDKFSLWGGDIWGKNIEVIDNKLLVQDWYSDDWKAPSKVKFVLTVDGKNTHLNLIHTDFPDDQLKDLKSGWEQFYLGPIKKILEQEYAK